MLHDEAYPDLGEPVWNFIARYLDGPETVLILLGSPGSGKTRLVRAILGEMSRRKGESAEVMYTGDTRAFEGDAIFVSFIHDAFVVEDADHLLTSLASGNLDLHRFLATLHTRALLPAEGAKLIARLCGGDPGRERSAFARTFSPGTKSLLRGGYLPCLRHRKHLSLKGTRRGPGV